MTAEAAERGVGVPEREVSAVEKVVCRDRLTASARERAIDVRVIDANVVDTVSERSERGVGAPAFAIGERELAVGVAECAIAAREKDVVSGMEDIEGADLVLCRSERLSSRAKRGISAPCHPEQREGSRCLPPLRDPSLHSG